MSVDVDLPPPVGLIEIARVLEESARLLRRHARAAGEMLRSDRETMTASEVRAVIEVRQLRRRYLGIEADDAAWSMMLELYASRLERRHLHQTKLSVCAGVAETTALRVTHKMLTAGLFTAKPHPTDKRLVVIGLSETMAERIRVYLEATWALAGLAA